MKFLVFDKEGLATALAWRLKLEGNDVRFLSLEDSGKEHLENMVELVANLEDGLKFVGEDGYIICGDETSVTPLRDDGYKVYGGNQFLEKVENDRNFQAQILEDAGILVSNHHFIKNIDEAIRFINENPDKWVLKQMGHAPKTWNYVGKEDDGSDIIDQLEWMKQQPEFRKLKRVPFMLQEVVDGYEFACSAWWMKDDWKRRDDGSILLELNREHKKQGHGDTGLTTGEMGTVAKWSTNTKLFSETLEKLTDILKDKASDVVLNIDANCGIVEEEGEHKAYVFEITPREGYPSQSLNLHLMDIEAGKFYSDLIDGVQGEVLHKEDWGVVTVLGSGQFPTEVETENHMGSFKDQPIKIPQFQDGIDPDIHPLFIKYDPEKDFYRIASYYEYVIAATKSSESIKAANLECVDAMKKIDVRSPQYRHDIGTKFEDEELPVLEEWGYV